MNVLVNRSEIDLLQLIEHPRVATPENSDSLADDPAIASICIALQQVGHLIDRRIAVEGASFWRDVLFAYFNLSPIMYELLAFPRSNTSRGCGTQIQRRREYFRIAAILYLRAIWAQFGMEPTGTALYADKLAVGAETLDLQLPWASDDDSLRRWILLVGAGCSAVTDSTRCKFADLLVAHLAAADADLAPAPKSSLWCEAALGNLGQTIRAARTRYIC